MKSWIVVAVLMVSGTAFSKDLKCASGATLEKMMLVTQEVGSPTGLEIWVSGKHFTLESNQLNLKAGSNYSQACVSYFPAYGSAIVQAVLP